MFEENPFAALVDPPAQTQNSATASQNVSLPQRQQTTETNPLLEPRNLMAGLIGLAVATQPKGQGQSGFNQLLKGTVAGLGARGQFDVSAEANRREEQKSLNAQRELDADIEFRREQNANSRQQTRILGETRDATNQRLTLAEETAKAEAEARAAALRAAESEKNAMPNFRDFYELMITSSPPGEAPDPQTALATYMSSLSLYQRAQDPNSDIVLSIDPTTGLPAFGMFNESVQDSPDDIVEVVGPPVPARQLDPEGDKFREKGFTVEDSRAQKSEKRKKAFEQARAESNAEKRFSGMANNIAKSYRNKNLDRRTLSQIKRLLNPKTKGGLIALRNAGLSKDEIREIAELAGVE